MSNSFKHIEVDLKPHCLVIEICAGALNDLDLSHAIASEIRRAARESNHSNLVLDLRNVQILTSAGLVLFVKVLKSASEAGGRVAVCRASASVADVLRICRLVVDDPLRSDQLTKFKDSEAATAWFAEIASANDRRS